MIQPHATESDVMQHATQPYAMPHAANPYTPCDPRRGQARCDATRGRRFFAESVAVADVAVLSGEPRGLRRVRENGFLAPRVEMDKNIIPSCCACVVA